MGYAFAVIAIILVAVTWQFTVYQEFQRTLSWAQICNQDGGKIRQTGWGSHLAYECFKDGKIIDHVN